MADFNQSVDPKQPCKAIIRMSGTLVQCGIKRYINQECPKAADHINVCPTCESPAPEKHPAWQYEGEVNVCKDEWHSSTHRGREMMNRLVGHAYFDYYSEGLKKIAGDEADAQPVIRSVGRTTGPEGPIAGAERDGAAMPRGSGVSVPGDLSQAVLRDLRYSIRALLRLENTLTAYEHQMMVVSLQGKVLGSLSPPAGPEHGQVAQVGGAPGLNLVYLSEDGNCPPDGPGWYPFGEQAIGPLVDEVGHKLRQEQALGDYAAAQREYDTAAMDAYDAQLTAEMTPGGTRPVGMGELGSDEMPGMWEASDVMGGQSDHPRPGDLRFEGMGADSKMFAFLQPWSHAEGSWYEVKLPGSAVSQRDPEVDSSINRVLSQHRERGGWPTCSECGYTGYMVTKLMGHQATAYMCPAEGCGHLTPIANKIAWSGPPEADREQGTFWRKPMGWITGPAREVPLPLADFSIRQDGEIDLLSDRAKQVWTENCIADWANLDDDGDEDGDEGEESNG